MFFLALLPLFNKIFFKNVSHFVKRSFFGNKTGNVRWFITFNKCAGWDLGCLVVFYYLF